MTRLLLVSLASLCLASTASAAPEVWESDIGTGLNQFDDDCDYVSFGFDFDFYGQTYSGAWINSNGNLTFNGCNSAWDSPTIPEGSYRIVGPLYGDFNPYANGDVYVNTVGDSGERVFVATWEVVPEYSSSTSQVNTFQVQLYEGSNNILFGYNGLTTDGYNWNGPAMNVGISSGTGDYINSASGGAIPALDDTNICYAWDGGAYTERFGGCNVAPVADAGGPYAGGTVDASLDVDPDTFNLSSNGRWVTAYVEVDADGYGPVVLDGGASSDADGDALTYSWTVYDMDGDVYDTAEGVAPEVWLQAGDYDVELVVNDGTEDSEVALSSVSVALLDASTLAASDLELNGVAGDQATWEDPTLVVKFDRAAVGDTLSVGDAVDVWLGGAAEGVDTIRVIDQGSNGNGRGR